MKRIRKRETPPAALTDYIRENPEASDAHTWDSFRSNCPNGLRAVQQALYEDQGGLCAYCELELVPRFDFRVSHFHPKRAKGEESSHSWELRWDNMHGACNGGEVFYYLKRERYVKDQTAADKHCDTAIGNEILDDKILNPLQIPADRRLFRYEEEPLEAGKIGLKIEPDEGNCAAVRCPDGQACTERARQTVKLLHLNSANLMLMREALYEEIKSRIDKCISDGDGLEVAMEKLAEKAFASKTRWPEFFTVWRWALRDKAEARLRNIDYNG